MADLPEIVRAIRDFQTDVHRDASFRLIYQTYFKSVQGYFRRKGFKDLCDDLTQDAFLRVYRKLEDYEHRERFAAWLFTIAENVARHEWQRRGTQKRRAVEVSYDEGPRSGEREDGGFAAATLPSVAPAQEEEVYDRQRQGIVEDAIRALAPRQRECLTLRLLGHGYRDIATLLRISPETVKQHLVAGRKQLRLQLDGLDLASFDAAASA